MMTNKGVRDELFHDRLTGQQVLAPEVDGTLLGRWLLRSEVYSGVLMNSAPADGEEFLVPDPTGAWTVTAGLPEQWEGNVSRQQLPEELEAESLKSIGDRLKFTMQKKGGWLEWIDSIPLVSWVSDEIGILPFERGLSEYFGHLDSVCKNPRAFLRVELDRMPVSRAKRTPPKAGSYLASHTEDWDGRLIRGIMPKRVLAEVRDDQLDIYENRVVARLLDHLLGYLNRRILKLKKLLKMFQDKDDYSSGATGGTYQRRERIMALWGDAIDSNESKSKALSTLKELEKIKYMLLGLMDSVLYRSVPRRTYVSTTLRMTNILTSDPNYRRLAELWRKWSSIQAGTGGKKKAKEKNQEYQRLCRGMDRFVMLLVVRALDQLGYEPTGNDVDQPIEREVLLHLQGDVGGVDLLWNSDGTLSLRKKKGELRILPLSVDLKGSQNERVVKNSMDRIREATCQESVSIIIAYAGDADTRKYLSTTIQKGLHTVGNDPRFDKSRVGFLPVSPWGIGSTERIVRALRWFLTGKIYVEYPWSFKVSYTAEHTCLFSETDWLAVKNDNENIFIRLKRPPYDYEWEKINLTKNVELARKELSRCENSHQQVAEELRVAVKSSNGTGALNRMKSEAYQKCLKAESSLEEILKIEAKLNAIHVESKSLLRCPICGSNADSLTAFQPQDRECFNCFCSDCKSEWGTRFCPNGHKYAVLLPSGKFSTADEDEPGWVDRIYGGDLLALPAQKAEGEWGFVCPECGDIS